MDSSIAELVSQAVPLRPRHEVSSKTFFVEDDNAAFSFLRTSFVAKTLRIVRRIMWSFGEADNSSIQSRSL